MSAEVSVGDVSSWQYTVAWVMLVLVFATIIAGRLAMRYSWLEDDQRRHLREIRPAIAGASWHRISISTSDDRRSRFETVGEAMNGRLEQTGGGVRTAVADVHAAAQRYAPVEVPPLAVRGAVEGLLVLVCGLLLSIPLTQWERLFEAPGGGVSPGAAVGVVAAGIDALAWLIGATIPASETVFGLVLSVVILGGQLVTTLWPVLGLALLAGAAGLTWLNATTEDDLDETLYPDRRACAKRVALWVGGIWATSASVGALHPIAGLAVLVLGAIVAVGIGLYRFVWRVFDIAGLDPFGDESSDISPLGLGSEFDAFDDTTEIDPVEVSDDVKEGVCPGLEYDPFEAALNLEAQLDDTDHEWRGDPARPAVAAYLFARKSLAAVVALTVPVLVYLAGQTLLSGALIRPLAAFGAAPLWGQLAMIGAPIAVLAYLSSYAEGRAAEHVRAFRRWVATRVIQSAGFARGIPIVAVVLGMLVGWAYTSAVGGVIAAAIAGVGSRSALLLYERGRVRAGAGLVRSGPYLVGATVFAILAIRTGAPLAGGIVALVVTGLSLGVRRAWRRYGLGLGESERQRRPPTDQVVEIPATPAVDADGEPIFIARVDGRPLAAREPERLFRDIQRVVNTRFETGETPTLLAHEFYEDIVSRGVVDEASVAKAVRGDLATRVQATVREKNGVDTDVLEAELSDEYPHELIDPTLEWLENRQDIGVRDGQYVPVN